MSINVQYFARYRETLGLDGEQVESRWKANSLTLMPCACICWGVTASGRCWPSKA